MNETVEKWLRRGLKAFSLWIGSRFMMFEINKLV